MKRILQDTVIIQFIPFSKMVNKQLGNWYTTKLGLRKVEIAKTGNPLYDLMIAMHEIFEQTDCILSGISEREVNLWDDNCQDDEPGENKKAPYHKQHMREYAIEKAICKIYRIDFKKYLKTTEQIWKKGINA